MAKDPVSWREAPDLAELAAPIIEAHHPHLDGFPVRFVWRSEARKVGKRKTNDPVGAAGTCEIVSGRFAFFVMTDEEKQLAEDAGAPGKMFWIEIAEPIWEMFTEAQRIALLDHEICHCGVAYPEEKDGAEMFLIEHDSEEFKDIVRRHGLWEPGLEDMAAVMLGFEIPE